MKSWLMTSWSKSPFREPAPPLPSAALSERNCILRDPGYYITSRAQQPPKIALKIKLFCHFKTIFGQECIFVKFHNILKKLWLKLRSATCSTDAIWNIQFMHRAYQRDVQILFQLVAVIQYHPDQLQILRYLFYYGSLGHPLAAETDILSLTAAGN